MDGQIGEEAMTKSSFTRSDGILNAFSFLQGKMNFKYARKVFFNDDLWVMDSVIISMLKGFFLLYENSLSLYLQSQLHNLACMLRYKAIFPQMHPSEKVVFP